MRGFGTVTLSLSGAVAVLAAAVAFTTRVTSQEVMRAPVVEMVRLPAEPTASVTTDCTSEAASDDLPTMLVQLLSLDLRRLFERHTVDCGAGGNGGR